MLKKEIHIYTDGAARGNPGPAGWGAVFLVGTKVFEMGGRADHATNNIMELTAPIETLKYVKKHKIEAEILFFADSKYVITANKKPVLNQELWQELHALNQEFKAKWHYVKGHNGDKWNDRADEIATSFADDAPVAKKKNKFF